MRIFKKLSVWFGLLALAGLAACASLPDHPQSPSVVAATPERAGTAVPLILISIDGFHPDYLTRGVTPNLNAIGQKGVSAAMRPSFPSVTFPNHYTLVTGLRPDHHGIVGNTMRDPQRPEQRFALSNAEAVTDRFWWDDGVPFWVSAEQAGMKTGTMFWPGSEADIRGVRPSYYVKFNQKLPGNARVDQVLAWLDLPEAERPQATTLYFDIVDTAGHHHGPDSERVNEAVASVDQSIGYLLEQLKARGLEGRVNIVVVSDHGMSPTSADRGVFLDELIPADSYRFVTLGPVAMLNAVDGRDAEVAAGLLKDHEHMQCWRKGEVPERLHFGTHRRVPEFVCMAEARWLIAQNRTKGVGYTGGAHGYDPESPDMASSFIAAGPDIRQGVALEVFDNVDVYPFVMRLLKLQPEPNDGSLKLLEPALR
ncbi:ectonucleotide pyrophosphatase/phosphodiesterase [Asticcacaulis tiandongensis]|uniref:alkaline phosphatase family protein n=1 Tax=Asticcacaulis tiandongensis TaxID=2565365 RepID=UPI00112DD93B|nr:ectonucleotide pyrophosphatase/phosphodiesterase [Asticcacaulis tiandongensis]